MFDSNWERTQPDPLILGQEGDGPMATRTHREKIAV